MSQFPVLWRVKCSGCDASRVIGIDWMLDRLRQAGFLRRDPKPDPRIVIELFSGQSHRFTCDECGSTRVTCKPHSDDDGDWGDSRVCEICREPIPGERLELFPDAKRCAACMNRPDNRPEELDYCRHCGGVMTTKMSRASGIARYKMVCSDCGRAASNR